MSNEVIQIAIENLCEHKQNKKYFHDLEGDDFELLCESLSKQGMIHPIVVAKDSELAEDSTYTILSGHQRVRAARELGWQKVPAIIAEVASPDQQQDVLLNANLGRRLSLVEKYRVAAHIMEKQGDNKGGRPSKEIPAKNERVLNREEIAAAAGISIHDITILNKVKKLRPTDQAEFYDWVDEENPNRKTILKRLRQVQAQKREYKEIVKEHNELKRKSKLAKELESAARRIQSPEDYRDSEAIEQLREELSGVRVSNSEAFGRLKAIPVPESELVLNWVRREAGEVCELLRSQADEIAGHFGLKNNESFEPAGEDAEWDM